MSHAGGSNLERKVAELEGRVRKLEEALSDALAEKAAMDDLYRAAASLVIKQQKASVIFLQRHLLIDMDRAKKLLNQLESRGVIGPGRGSAPREILK
jgi:DNA segregation ATPase FtsK/SpoIIIE-like protein